MSGFSLNWCCLIWDAVRGLYNLRRSWAEYSGSRTDLDGHQVASQRGHTGPIRCFTHAFMTEAKPKSITLLATEAISQSTVLQPLLLLLCDSAPDCVKRCHSWQLLSFQQL